MLALWNRESKVLGNTAHLTLWINQLSPFVVSLAAGDEAAAPFNVLLRGGEEQSEVRGHLAGRREIVELYDRLRPSLYQYLLCLGLSPEDSDDVIQEAFLRLFRFQAGGGTITNP